MVIASRNSKRSVLGFVLSSPSIRQEVWRGSGERSRGCIVAGRGRLAGQREHGFGCKGQTPCLSTESTPSSLRGSTILAVAPSFPLASYIKCPFGSVVPIRAHVLLCLFWRRIIPGLSGRQPTALLLFIANTSNEWSLLVIFSFSPAFFLCSPRSHTGQGHSST